MGVTNSILRRVREHKEDRIPAFTKKYRIHRLVYFESFQYVWSAIAREKQVKAWRRSRKVALIEAANPTWADLAEGWISATHRKEQIPRPKSGLGMTARSGSRP